jgi:hypothetical protein
MIYNYETGDPIAILPIQANAIFPNYNFGNANTYFIYPDEGIIYNYTTGKFFIYNDNIEYTPPAVNLNTLGALIGYTQKNLNQLPTLYYANGRLTRQHAMCENIGWHPRHVNFNYASGNMRRADFDEIDDSGVYNAVIFNQKVAAAVNDHTDQVVYVELYYNNQNEIEGTHPSRSRLILGAPNGVGVANVSLFLAANEQDPQPF